MYSGVGTQSSFSSCTASLSVLSGFSAILHLIQHEVLVFRLQNLIMPITHISVRGARQHNLRDISVRIPRNTLT